MSERKAIDGALRRFLDEQAAASGPRAQITGPGRVRMLRAIMLGALESRASIPGLPNEVETRDLEIAPGLAARLYMPLCEPAGAIVVSVEYRLAPEHPYPAALEDTLAAVHWAGEHAAEWGGDPARLALGGDSAGANLSAVAANRLCAAAGARALCALLLLFPVTDHPSAGHASYEENATGYGLDANGMRWL